MTNWQREECVIPLLDLIVSHISIDKTGNVDFFCSPQKKKIQLNSRLAFSAVGNRHVERNLSNRGSIRSANICLPWIAFTACCVRPTFAHSHLCIRPLAEKRTNKQSSRYLCLLVNRKTRKFIASLGFRYISFNLNCLL